MSSWLSLYLVEQGYHINFKADSYKELDRFFDEYAGSNIFKNNDAYCFAMASYIGEVFRLLYRGKWHISSNINYNDINDRDILVKLKNGKVVYPLEAISLRMQKKMLLQDIISE